MTLHAINGAVLLLVATGVLLLVLDAITTSPTRDELES